MPQILMFRILGSMRLVIGILGLIANVFQAAYCKIMKKHKTDFEMSLISLCLADIFTSLTLIGLGSVEITFKLKVYYFVMNILLNSFGITMFIHTILIAAQRLIAVVYPLRVKIILSKRRFYVLLALTWILGCTYGIGIAFAVKTFIRVNCYVIFVSSIALMTLYAGISFKTYRKDKVSRHLTRREDRRRSRAVLLHSFLVTTAFIICFVPFAIHYLFIENLKPIFILFDLLVSINPLLDAVVYFYIKHCRRNKGLTAEVICNTTAFPVTNSNVTSVESLSHMGDGTIETVQEVELSVITKRI